MAAESLFSPQPAGALTLSQYAAMVRQTVAADHSLYERWVTAELSDVRATGHCYMELIEKNAAGQTVAKMRATLWRNRYYAVAERFRRAGIELRSGIKVMLRGTAAFHEQYGMAFNISDIDPSYTLGDMEQLRRRILAQLKAEGVLDTNRSRVMPLAPQRIAVISASGAAGYGDFMNQLRNNPYGLVFYPVLFEAVVQGDRTAPTVMDALERIEMAADAFDCVVIIRGGGATTDLNGFDNLELARAVATYVLPVIVGIGHERDRTVLDEIAHTRVKTPTAAAEWLVARGADTLARIDTLARSITQTAQSIVSGSREQLSQMETRLHALGAQRLSVASQRLASMTALLPQLAAGRLGQARQRLDAIAAMLPQTGASPIRLQQQRLDYLASALRQYAALRMRQATEQLDRLGQLTDALSPEATLKRGYSLTVSDGHVVTDAGALIPGQKITTRFAAGSVQSIVEKAGD